MYSFKCHHRQMLVKRIITQYTTIYTVGQIMGTEFDAIRWIDAAWNNVADIIIRNCSVRPYMPNLKVEFN